jgi:hypothetical protein
MCAIRYTEAVQYITTSQLAYNGRQDYNQRMLWEEGKSVAGKWDQTIFCVQMLVQIYRTTDVFCQNNKLSCENNISLYVIFLFKSSFSENSKQLPCLIRNPL